MRKKNKGRKSPMFPYDRLGSRIRPSRQPQEKMHTVRYGGMKVRARVKNRLLTVEQSPPPSLDFGVLVQFLFTVVNV